MDTSYVAHKTNGGTVFYTDPAITDRNPPPSNVNCFANYDDDLDSPIERSTLRDILPWVAGAWAIFGAGVIVGVIFS